MAAYKAANLNSTEPADSCLPLLPGLLVVLLRISAGSPDGSTQITPRGTSLHPPAARLSDRTRTSPGARGLVTTCLVPLAPPPGAAAGPSPVASRRRPSRGRGAPRQRHGSEAGGDRPLRPLCLPFRRPGGRPAVGRRLVRVAQLRQPRQGQLAAIRPTILAAGVAATRGEAAAQSRIPAMRRRLAQLAGGGGVWPSSPASGPAHRRRRCLRSPQRRPAPVQDNVCAAGLAAVRPWRQRATISARRYTGIGPGYAGNGGPRYEADALRGPERDASRPEEAPSGATWRGTARRGRVGAAQTSRAGAAGLFFLRWKDAVW